MLTGTATEGLQNPLPTVTTVTATQTVPTTSYTLDVKGTGFVTGSTVSVTGFTTTSNVVVSATEMTAVVSVNYGTTSLAVAAVNPSPGGSTSTAKNVTIAVAGGCGYCGALAGPGYVWPYSDGHCACTGNRCGCVDYGAVRHLDDAFDDSAG